MKNTFISAGVAVLVVVLGFMFFAPNQSETIGAIPGNSIDGPEFCVGGLCYSNSVGTCASSGTLFSVSNPFAATSTAELVLMVGTGNATTTTLNVGTSTSATVTSQVGSLVKTVSVATTSKFAIASGSTLALGTGQVSSGTNSVIRTVVGPSQRVTAFATTTAVGAGAKSFSAGFAGCKYKIQWVRY